MAYTKVISGRRVDLAADIKRMMNFMCDKFGATRESHPLFNNLVVLDSRLWWAVPTTDETKVDVRIGKEYEVCEVMEKIKDLNAGLLILRQFSDNQLRVYLIDDIDKLLKHCESSLMFGWYSIDCLKRFSESGLVLGDDLLGFKELRKLRLHAVDGPHQEAV